MKQENTELLKRTATRLFLTELLIALNVAPATIGQELVEVSYLQEHIEALHLIAQQEYINARQHYFNASIDEQNKILDEYINEIEAETINEKVIYYLATEHSELFIKLINKIQAEEEAAEAEAFNKFMAKQ